MLFRSVAWSGDAASLQKDLPGLEFIIPTKGGMSFTDNMLIPIAAGNARGAAMMMNYLYDPAVAGPLFESIVYVPPVVGALDYMSATARSNQFISPPADARLFEFGILSQAVDDEIAALFVEATQL